MIELVDAAQALHDSRFVGGIISFACDFDDNDDQWWWW